MAYAVLTRKAAALGTFRLRLASVQARRFKNKVAIVTGGNSGIGKEVARRLLKEGGLVVVNGRNAAKTKAAVKEIDPSGGRWRM